MTLFGTWVVADVIKDLGRRTSWINQVGPKSNDKCPSKKQKPRRHGEERRRPWKAGPESAMKRSQGTQGATRSWERQGRVPLGVCGPADALTSDPWLQNLERRNFLLLL